MLNVASGTLSMRSASRLPSAQYHTSVTNERNNVKVISRKRLGRGINGNVVGTEKLKQVLPRINNKLDWVKLESADQLISASPRC